MITSHFVSCKSEKQKLCPGMLSCALKPYADKLQSNEPEDICLGLTMILAQCLFLNLATKTRFTRKMCR